MPVVLLVAHAFPPDEGIAAQRPAALARHLPELGWDVEVLTAAPAAPPVRSTPATGPAVSLRRAEHALEGSGRKALSRVAAGLATSVEVPDPAIGWLRPAVRAGRALLRTSTVDVVLSTSGPATAHLIGARLAAPVSPLAWVADFRDLWSQNHFFKHGRIRRAAERKLEQGLVRRADALMTVSQPLAAALSELHSRPVTVATNGFEPLHVPRLEHDHSCFRIVYTGNLYGGRRDPRPLLRSLRRLADGHRIDPTLVEVHFFGPSVDEALAASNETRTREIVQVHGAVSRERSIAEQARANVLLALNWDHAAEAGTYTGKIFEYLSTGHPIVALGGPPGVLSDLLRSTGGGEHLDSEASELIDRHLLMLYEQWRAGTPTRGADPQRLTPYTWRAVSKTVAQVLEQACSTRRAR